MNYDELMIHIIKIAFNLDAVYIYVFVLKM